MKKEIAKGTQKFIWHLLAFAFVFALIMVVLCRILPEPAHTSAYDHPRQTTVTTQSTNDNPTDFDSVKERVDQANNTTGKEVKSLYSGEGKSTIQKQFEIRLFFNTLKSILICVLLVVVVVVLIKKGFSLKKVKKFFDEGDETTYKDTPDEIPETEDTPAEAVPGEETPDADEETEDDTSDEEEPPIVDPAEPDERKVVEKCKL